MAAPTYRVEINFSGSTWTDVSSYVDVKRATIRFRRGRQRAFAPAATGTASFTLNNKDGRFTPGNTSGAYSPNVARRKGVRIYLDGTTSTYRVFTGFVDRWTVRLDGNEAFTDVECVDVLKLMSSTVLQSMAIEEAAQLIADDGSLWPLADANATLGDEWDDWRDGAMGPITIKGGFLGGKPGSHDFVDEAPRFMKGSIRLNTEPDAGNPYGPVLLSPLTPTASAGCCVMLWFKTTSAAVLVNMDRQSSGVGYLRLTLNSSGALVFKVNNDSNNEVTITRSTSPVTGAGFKDDTWHFVACGVGADGTSCYLYVDGNLYTTSAGSARTIGITDRRLTIGGFWDWTTDEPYWTLNGYLTGAGVLFSSFPSDSDLDDIYYAGTQGRGGSGSTMPGRGDDLHGYLGTPFGAITGDPSGYYVGGQATAGKDLLTCLDELAHVEGGVFYADHLGAIQYAEYADIASPPFTLTVSANADLADSDFEYVVDDDGYFNVLTVETTGAGSTTVEDATAIATDGVISESRTGVVAYDATSRDDYADRVLAWAADSTPAIHRLKIDLLTSTGYSAVRQAVARMPLLAEVTVSDLPTAVFGATSMTGTVQGYEVEMGVDRCLMTLELE